jgi:hypothetical protein
MDLRARLTGRLELLKETIKAGDIETAEVEAGRLVVDLNAVGRHQSVSPDENGFCLALLPYVKGALWDVSDGKLSAGEKRLQDALSLCASTAAGTTIRRADRLTREFDRRGVALKRLPTIHSRTVGKVIHAG